MHTYKCALIIRCVKASVQHLQTESQASIQVSLTNTNARKEKNIIDVKIQAQHWARKPVRKLVRRLSA